MTHTYTNNRKKDEPRPGFTLADQRSLIESDPSQGPKIQTFLMDDPESQMEPIDDKILPEDDDTMYIPTSQIDNPTWSDVDRDSSRPFFVSWNPDKEEQQGDGFEITYQSADKRIQRRKVTDISKLTEAIRF
jgi:hypothetical protein